MQRCGFAAKGLFVMDGSKRSAHANAYFTGFGAAKRVVFYDTLLKQLSPGEVDAVLAHELGHFKHKHIIKRIVSMFAMSLAGFALLGWLSSQVWFYTGLGVRPNLSGANDALACCCFCWWCRSSAFLSRRCSPSSRASTSSRPTPMPWHRPTAGTCRARCSSSTRTTPAR
jgi:Zn-dependent protease with chaperone function